MGKRINEDEASGWIWWEKHLKELASQKNDWPEGGLRGVFIGTSMQSSVAELCGCTNRYAKKPEILANVSRLVRDLRALEECDRICKIREEWCATHSEPWSERKLINILAATRLEEMLKDLFCDDATFYFTRKFEIVNGHMIDANWTLGAFLAL